ncbi:MAG: DUF5127 domain-containing protein, partial [Planctomycetes bacterium]|nr:DUF5127 domain-containing protein [Planctomycetota bacterium]
MNPKNAPRLPSVPLVAHDPYFSIWCPADKLTDVWATHWTGANNGLTGLIRIDGRTFRFCGACPEYPPLPQESCEVLPTRTIYAFAGEGVRLEVVFLTPALLHRLEILARPATYVCLAVTALDGRAHQVQAFFGAGADLCTEHGWQPVTWGRTRLPGLEALHFAAPGAPLNHAGDDARIDWGRAVLAAPMGAESAFGAGDALRA